MHLDEFKASCRYQYLVLLPKFAVAMLKSNGKLTEETKKCSKITAIEFYRN